MNIAIDILPINNEGGGVALRSAQRGVQNRAVFGHVNVFAREHGIAAFGEVHLFSEFEQKLHGLFGDEVLREVYMQVCGIKTKFLGAGRILLKPGSQIRSERCFVLG